MTDNAGDAIEEMKQLLGVSTDAALADALDLNKTAVAQWRRRNALPAHAVVRLQHARQKAGPLPDEGFEEAFPAVVGEHALMLSCLLTPSRWDLERRGAKEIGSDLATAASRFAELRVVAALAILRKMRVDRVGVQEAFAGLLLSPESLDAIWSATDG